MKRTKYQVDDERGILTAAIVHDRVLARIVAKAGKEPFSSRWSNLVWKWCCLHFQKYETAPKASIRSHFRHYAEKAQDEATVALVEKFLSGLSEEYAKAKKEINEDFTVDQAARYFNRVRIEKNQERVADALARGDVDEAMQEVSGFTPLQMASDDMVSLLDDPEPWREVLMETDEETLIHFGGALGDFFGNQFQRDALVAFLAPEKRGKSWMLLDIAWRAAIKNKRRTILYSVGDMSQRQIMKRIAARACNRPLKAGTLKIPERLRLQEGATALVKIEDVEFRHGLSWPIIKSTVKDLRMLTAASESTIKLKCTPNSTTRVADIEADIVDRIRQGWVPDVAVIDYADILAPERQLGGQDVRHQTDETWKALRRLSQKYHMLIVTATQSNAASYKGSLIRRENFSEDKRKLAHVTGMIGINQTEEEKERGIYRLNQVLLREGFYAESRCVTVAGCLALANPCMLSTW